MNMASKTKADEPLAPVQNGDGPRTGAGRPRVADIAHRIDHLVACAGNLFLEKGYHNVSLNLIAREAGVAVRTIYLKFGGKPGLFNAVIRAYRDSFFSDMDPMELGSRQLQDVLFDFGYRYLSLVTSARSIAIQRLVIAEAPYDAEISRTFVQTGPEPTLAMLSQFFSRPEVRCQLRADIPVDQLARNLMTCLLGDHLHRFLFNEAPPSDEVSRSAITAALMLFLDGSRKRVD